MTEVPVVWFDGYQSADATAYAIADNRTHEFAVERARAREAARQLRKEDALWTASASTPRHPDDLLRQLREQRPSTGNCSTKVPRSPPSRPRSAAISGSSGEAPPARGDSDEARRRAPRDERPGRARRVTDLPSTRRLHRRERPERLGRDWTDSCARSTSKDADGFFRAVFANVLDALGPARFTAGISNARCGDIQRIWRELASSTTSRSSGSNRRRCLDRVSGTSSTSRA